MGYIDLRSDTVTLPTDEMREAMAAAELGDDVFREDPTVNRLQERAAEMLGQEGGLLVTSGTQGNLVSLLAQSHPGDEVILEADSHVYNNEVAGLSRVAGLIPRPLPGHHGAFTGTQVEAALRPRLGAIVPPRQASTGAVRGSGRGGVPSRARISDRSPQRTPAPRRDR